MAEVTSEFISEQLARFVIRLDGIDRQLAQIDAKLDCSVSALLSRRL